MSWREEENLREQWDTEGEIVDGLEGEEKDLIADVVFEAEPVESL